MAKYTFDSRSLAEENIRPEPQMRPSAPLPGLEPGTKAPSWARASLARTLVMTLALGALLYFIFGMQLLAYIGNWLLIALFIPLVGELVAGLVRAGGMRRAGDERTIVANSRDAACWRKRNVFLWIVQLVMCVGVCVVVWVLVRERAASGEKLLSPTKVDGGRRSELSDRDKGSKATDKDLVLYLAATDGDVRQSFEFVRQSSFVQDNAQYAALMKDVEFVFCATSNEVNAVASRHFCKDGTLLRRITCYAGEVHFARTIALAAAAELSGTRGVVGRMMEKLTPRLCVKLSLDDAARLVRACDLDRFLLDESVLSKAKSIAAGELVAVLAHEAGHQVLGHNFQQGKDVLNNEVRRNFESQADLFASSVMSSCPFGEYVFAGRVFALWVQMRQTDPILERCPMRDLDHPLSKERFVALVMSNKDKAKALGIEIPEL